MINSPIRVLLADDDDDDCFFFDEILTGLSTTTSLTVAHDGEQLMDALRRPDTRLPDIVFLDLNMPRLSGYECLVQIRRDPRLTRLPVIIMSTFISPELNEKLVTIGVTQCIQKPADYNRLKTVIRQAIMDVVTTSGTYPADEVVQPGPDLVVGPL